MSKAETIVEMVGALIAEAGSDPARSAESLNLEVFTRAMKPAEPRVITRVMSDEMNTKDGLS